MSAIISVENTRENRVDTYEKHRLKAKGLLALLAPKAIAQWQILVMLCSKIAKLKEQQHSSSKSGSGH